MKSTAFDEVDRMMEQMRSAWDREGLRDGTSLVEQDGEFVFVMDLPGFERDDIELTFDDGTLSVAADRDADEGPVARRRHVDRRVTVPGDVDAESVTASYRNGVLEVRLPTADEDDGRRIEIED